MPTADLNDAAQQVLRLNDAGKFTKPSLRQYPHQWNWDSAIIALGLSYFDLPRAIMEIRSLLEGQWRDGLLPHVVYHEGADDYFPGAAFWGTERSPLAPARPTSGITQPPILATVLERIHTRHPIDEFLREVVPSLLRWHRWLHTARVADTSGLPCLIHPWESGTDDSPRWLPALQRFQPKEVPGFRRRDTLHVSPRERPYDDDYKRFISLIGIFRKNAYLPAALLQRSPFLVQDVMFLSILHRAEEDLRRLSLAIGQPVVEIDRWLAQTAAVFDQRFWDPAAGQFFDFDLRAQEPIRVNTAMSFMPLYAGLASREQAQRLMEAHWSNPLEYAPDARTRFSLPTTSKAEPCWDPRRYWRGPVWILFNWLLIEGLRRYALHEAAAALRRDTLELMLRSGFREYYDPRDGSGCGSQSFSWSAALAIDLLSHD